MINPKFNEILSDALAKNNGCDYCSTKEMNDSLHHEENYHDEWSDVDITDGKLLIAVSIILEYKEIEIEINYCPMCGRKL